jgi:hypothetical protein
MPLAARQYDLLEDASAVEWRSIAEQLLPWGSVPGQSFGAVFQVDQVLLELVISAKRA